MFNLVNKQINDLSISGVLPIKRNKPPEHATLMNLKTMLSEGKQRKRHTTALAK